MIVFHDHLLSNFSSLLLKIQLFATLVFRCNIVLFIYLDYYFTTERAYVFFASASELIESSLMGYLDQKGDLQS